MGHDFHQILPPNPPKQPGDTYIVWTAGPCRQYIEQVLGDLMEEAQEEGSPFRPDDLAEELFSARRHLAVAPDDPPSFCIYSEEKVVYADDGMPLFQPTHVLPGRIVNVWYVLWEKGKFVGICRLEPSAGRGEEP